MGKKIDLTGNRYGRLTVISESGRGNSNEILWDCKCDCGNSVKVVGSSLRGGSTKSCGCLRKEITSTRSAKNMVGKKCGKLTVIEKYGSNNENRALWTCKCECGNITVVTGHNLRSGNTKSCGCLWGSPAVTMTCPICGVAFEVKPAALKRGMGQYCSIKCMGIARQGDKSHAWKGGISFGDYCEKFNAQLKEEIREKYARECLICGKTEEENGRRLDVHHVDYNKDQGCSGKKWKLVPLCKSCHAKTNHNRYAWNALISYIIAYNYSKKEMNVPRGEF